MTTPTPTVPGLAALVERQRQQLAAGLDSVRSIFPLDHPYRHELESPAHEDACAHMPPGCPCDDPLPGVAHPKTAGGTS
jgi:hypothetical protein